MIWICNARSVSFTFPTNIKFTFVTVVHISIIYRNYHNYILASAVNPCSVCGIRENPAKATDAASEKEGLIFD